MNATIARRRLGATFTTQSTYLSVRKVGQQARYARRIAALLGPADSEYIREVTTDADGTCWMPADVLDALAGVS